MRGLAMSYIDASAALDVEPLLVSNARREFLKPLKALLEVITNVAGVA